MPKVFLSYRRDDAQGVVGRIFDRLQSHFGRESVFMDVDTIPFGVDFRQHLTVAVTRAEVLVAVIGSQWLTAQRDGQRRLDDPGDFVRFEIELALTRGIPVIPVLIGRTPMLAASDLPSPLEPLAYRNALPVDPGRELHIHTDCLIRAVELLCPGTNLPPASDERPLPKTRTPLVFVSKNKDKYSEYKRLLCLHDLKLSEIEVPDVQDMNLESHVRRKVEFALPILASGPFFVEHTGLIIDAWKGLPGGLTKTFMQTVGSPGICKMLQAYTGSQRSARIKSVIGFHCDDAVQIFEGSLVGTIAPEPRGQSGFGWDNIFIPVGEAQTFGEMGEEKRDRISMRQKVAAELAGYLSLHLS